MTDPDGLQARAPIPAYGAAPPADLAADSLRAVRVVLRPIANPFALGFLGLAGATLTVSGLELGWIPPSERVQVALIVLAFAPPLQLIACLFGFLGRDPVAATGMGVLAATWAVIGITLLVSAPGSHSAALGTVLFLASVAMLLTAATAAMSKGVPALVLGVAGLRFLATALYEIIGTAPFNTVSGIVGCVLAVLAVYGAVAFEVEGVKHRTVLPTLRHGAGSRALEPNLPEQVEQVAAEAGVRAQL